MLMVGCEKCGKHWEDTYLISGQIIIIPKPESRHFGEVPLLNQHLGWPRRVGRCNLPRPMWSCCFFRKSRYIHGHDEWVGNHLWNWNSKASGLDPECAVSKASRNETSYGKLFLQQFNFFFFWNLLLNIEGLNPWASIFYHPHIQDPCLCTQLNATECSHLVETSAFTLIESVAVF